MPVNMRQDGRRLDQPNLPVDGRRESAESVEIVLGPGLFHDPGHVFSSASSEHAQGAFGIDSGIPDVQDTHVAVAAHPFSVGARALAGRFGPIRFSKSIASRDHEKAGRESLQVPFPRTGQRFIKIIQVEQQMPLGTGEDAEIEQMSVTAKLGSKAGYWS